MKLVYQKLKSKIVAIQIQSTESWPMVTNHTTKLANLRQKLTEWANGEGKKDTLVPLHSSSVPLKIKSCDIETKD